MDSTRTERLIGPAGLRALQAARVAVIGLGGVGSYAAEALCRSGVGHLYLVDGDVVTPSNCNRQLMALSSTVGQAKAELFAVRLRDINAECEVGVKNAFYKLGQFTEFFGFELDYIVDAIDDVSAKVDILQQCHTRSIPVISSMGTGNKLDPTKLSVTDISKTNTCPLAKKVRLALRQAGISRGIEVVFSTELPVTSATPPGSMAFVPAAAGLIMASVVVRRLINKEGAEA